MEEEKQRSQAAEEKVLKLEQCSLKQQQEVSKKLNLQIWKQKESLAENALLKQQLDAAKKDEAAWVKRCEVLLGKKRFVFLDQLV